MNLTVFGIGYVGLVQAAVLAEVGHEVVCVDVDAEEGRGAQPGLVPIFEPGLEDLVKENHAAGRIKFTTDAAAAVKHGEIQFIAVGTPPDEDGSADLKYVLAVAETIGREMDRAQGRRRQVDRAGRHRRQGQGQDRRDAEGARAARIWPSTWSPTRSSSRRAPPSPTA